MRWYRGCFFCSMPYREHDDGCAFAVRMRAARCAHPIGLREPCGYLAWRCRLCGATFLPSIWRAYALSCAYRATTDETEMEKPMKTRHEPPLVETPEIRLTVTAREVRTHLRSIAIAFAAERANESADRHVAIVETSDSTQFEGIDRPRIRIVPAQGSLTRAEWEQMKRAGDRAWSEYEARFM